jgi:glycosyltransferase involved in cell wall biosynthesis
VLFDSSVIARLIAVSLLHPAPVKLTVPPSQPVVSVILPCRNEAAHIESCLNSILLQDVAEGDLELIVADGMSTDGTREILQRLANLNPQVRVIENPSGIVSTGLNAAIRAARGQVIVRMDAHTEYSVDYVQRCLETLNRMAVENVGGPARTKASTFRQKAIAAAYHSPFSVGGARFHDSEFEGFVDTVTYGCWPRDVFNRFGYFDEELVRNQDDEHNLRIVRGGGRIWQSPQIKSWYQPRSSLSALFKQYVQYGYWKVRVIQKHKLPASWRHLVPGAFLLSLLSLFLLSTFCFLVSELSGPSPLVFRFSFLLAASCFTGLLSVYALAVLAASVHTAPKSEWKLLPVLPAVFACYHFGYGYGFLRGVWDFLVRRRRSNLTFAQLTR